MKHGAAAQRGQGIGRPNLSLNTLHAIPEALCDDIAWASEQPCLESCRTEVFKEACNFRAHADVLHPG